MSAKTTYWLAGPDGTFVQVDGAARRDEVSNQGWAEAAGPDQNARVWLQHQVTGAFALFGAASLDVWQAVGWQFAVPPTERGDNDYVVALPAQNPATAVELADTPTPEPAPPVDKPNTDTVKEKTRG